MDAARITAILNEVAGHPQVGPVAEAIPAMAKALDDELNPKAKAKDAPVKADSKG